MPQSYRSNRGGAGRNGRVNRRLQTWKNSIPTNQNGAPVAVIVRGLDVIARRLRRPVRNAHIEPEFRVLTLDEALHLRDAAGAERQILRIRAEHAGITNQ